MPSNERYLVGGDIISQVDGGHLVMGHLRPSWKAEARETVQITIYRGRPSSEKSSPLTEVPRQRGYRF